MLPKNQRQARRLMERMGMQVESLSDVNQVIIRTATREIIIDQPDVTLTHLQGQNIYQIMGGKVSEAETATAELTISEEDVSLVAQQTNSSLEAARKALEESQGDLEQDIICLL